MELIKLSDKISIDGGAPSPTIISNDTELNLLFYSSDEQSGESLEERNFVYDRGIFALKFNFYLVYKFGVPGNETIMGHPYHRLGIQPYSCYLLKESEWIRELMRIDSVHPYHDKEKFKSYNHYVFTFHDNMFECIAKNFQISHANKSVYEEASLVLGEMSLRMI
jgi:hypothetical protein